jgi:hypothetical protein
VATSCKVSEMPPNLSIDTDTQHQEAASRLVLCAGHIRR